jgi:AcrR family transcriptional regulator
MSEIVSRKVQIEGIATELFRKKGYAATSMRDLAQAVGMEAASIYSHIKNKEALLSSICFRLADAFMDAKKEMELQTMPAPQLLQKAIEAHVRVITNNLDASAVFLHEWRHLSPEPLAEFIALRKAYENYLIRIIQQGKEEGKFQFEDEKIAVLSLLSGLNWIYDWYKPEGKLTPEQVAQNLSQLLLNGLTKK